ncbi:DNA cytosine methyltransferase [Streptomyces albus]|uniref:DNA cytosine methyltransferase n=1 Tax=Streptomyces albus TaxID=1888 RepID=UPI003879461A
MSPRIGSLFTGTGALDLAVQDVYGGEMAWHCQFEPPDKHGKPDRHQWAAQILARHWPEVPNLGDITAIDWHAVLGEYGPVDVLTGGFPCQDISSAGKRAGLAPGTRSGLWAHMARAISVLRPRLVVIENVEGLLSRKAHRDLGPDAEAVDEGPARGALRALGAVLGDLATLGFDAEWARVAASEVGAPHSRKRVFICAWPAAADTPDDGHERAWAARRRRPGPADRDLTAADTDGGGLQGHSELPAGRQPLQRRLRDDADRRQPSPADCPSCLCPVSDHDIEGLCAGCLHCTDPDLGQPGFDCGNDCEVCGTSEAPADPPCVGRGEGWTEPARQQGRPDAALGGDSDVDWGAYGPAIRRWEYTLGRRAPRPVDDLGRLSPAFTEWLMGLPAGWVTDTPGITRPAALKSLGNGVVPQQAAAALRLLRERMPAHTRLPLAGQPSTLLAA